MWRILYRLCKFSTYRRGGKGLSPFSMLVLLVYVKDLVRDPVIRVESY